jgi:16S rRNA (guanine966-N2)-methyltransferase
MRIISGKHRGRRIELLKEATDVIRPTSDFAREAIFNILNHADLGLDRHPYLDQPVLDVFCGTGALGLEALSRGASKVTFVDKSREALINARHNIMKMNEEKQTELVQADAGRLPLSRTQYGLVFLDPPYFTDLLIPALQSLKAGGWLTPDALLIVEHDAKQKMLLPEGFTAIDTRRYGRANVELLRLT